MKFEDQSKEHTTLFSNHMVDLHKIHLRWYIAKLRGFFRIQVTPEMAKAWLEELNTHNRSVNKKIAEGYARTMKKGEWELNGEPIIFSDEGTLMDGQHRLYGVIEAGIPIWFDFAFGIKRAAFDTLGGGKMRSAGDVLSIAGYNSSHRLSGVVKTYISLVQKKQTLEFHRKLTSRDILRFVDENPDIVDFVNDGRSLYRKSNHILTVPEFGGYRYFTSKIDEEKSRSFFEQLASGVGLTEKSPIYKLRQILIKDIGNKQGRMKGSYRRALVIKAWNYYRAGKEVNRISFNPDKEDFPEFL